MAESEAGAKRKYRLFSSPGRGGLGFDPKKTAVLFIEMQNEFTTEGGKLHGQVREVMALNNMLGKASVLAHEVRKLGVKVFHAPITFAGDGSDNPNKHLGILAGCDFDKLFERGSWNAAICDVMQPVPGDVVVEGKRGLSAFPETDLEQHLIANKIETIALSGFMANCCVESTMRDAFEKGFNVVTLTDCVATTSLAGYKAAVDITYPFFSTPLNAASFVANLKASVALDNSSIVAPAPKRAKSQQSHPKPSFAMTEIADSVYQVGPWFVDVRQSAVGEKIVLGSGAKELRRYLTFAEASGMMGSGICARCDAVYTEKMPTEGSTTEPFGWLCNMVVVRLPEPDGGCLVYSPVLGADNTLDSVASALKERNLLPVRIIVAPTPQHHLALQDYQKMWPDAFFICGKASGQMPPLTRKRRDLRFDGVMFNDSNGEVQLGAPVCDREGAATDSDGGDKRATMLNLLQTVFDICIVDDNRTGEIIFMHQKTNTLILSDLLYKSNADVVGPGGSTNHYTTPEWFAEGQQELFYGYPQDNSHGLLPAYRTHPRMRSIDIPGTRRSLDKILAWPFVKALACHTDPINGADAVELIKKAWAWVWDK